MSEGLYELLALFARYIFAGLMVLIVVRAWRITLVDSRRAKTLRRISPETGIIGELMVLEGNEKARRGMKYKVIREGQIGSARRADIRIRHSSVRRRHAYFLLTEEGLKVRAHAGAPLRDEGGHPVREILLQDGDSIEVGRVQLMLILSQAPEAERLPVRRKNRRGDDYIDDSFESVPDDDLFDPGDDLFDSFDASVDSVPTCARPSRRHLPFTLEEGPSTRYTSGVPHYRRYADPDTLRPGIRRSGSDGFTPDPAPVADNPLNTRRPQHTPARPVRTNTDDLTDDDEMW